MGFNSAFKGLKGRKGYILRLNACPGNVPSLIDVSHADNFKKIFELFVGVATDLRAGRSGIESRWGPHFPHLSRPALGST